MTDQDRQWIVTFTKEVTAKDVNDAIAKADDGKGGGHWDAEPAMSDHDRVIVRAAAGLLGPTRDREDVDPEYTRAIVELTIDASSLWNQDDQPEVRALLDRVSDGEPV